VENPYSLNATIAPQDYMKEKFPLYTTDEYRANRDAGKWYKNMFGEGMGAF